MTKSNNDKPSHGTGHSAKGGPLWSMMVAATGIVYGDIGTSPLYAFKESLNPAHGIDPTDLNILGILSLLIWSLIIVVTVKYIALVMRADNKGEGGTMALMALVQRSMGKKSHWALSLGLFGVCLLYGDGIITPAISVLSAVEGLTLVAPHFNHRFVILTTLAVIVFLFAFQRFGTAKIGRFFGPITVLWFFTIGAIGLVNIIRYPHILHAFNPWYGMVFLGGDHVWLSFVLLGTIVLAITGVEALYADMGHFGAKPIRLTWLGLVMPALILNYLGQGALVLNNPATLSNPFYLSFPEWMLLPVVILATCATVIASQAMISGAFSMTQQAVQLGFSPRFDIRHTSARHMGQIYLPRMNMLLFIGVVILVLVFKTSSNLAAAYGIAVTGTILITTCLITLVARYQWNWSWWKVIPLFGFLFIVDMAFFSANLLKIKDGGWLPLVLGAGIFTLMITWRDGQLLTFKRRGQQGERVTHFVNHLPEQKIHRIPGAAAYLSRDIDHVSYALALNLKHNKVLHEQVLLVRIDTLDVPRVPDSERLIVKSVGQGIYCISIQYGFMQEPNVPRALSHVGEHGVQIELRELTYVLGRETVIATKRPGMAMWRERLYAAMSRNGASAMDFYHLPHNRVIEIGRQVAI
jgi:KUP system potassium uptake protein